MSHAAKILGAAALLWAAQAAAQERGTVEFGAFGSAGRFDKDLTLDKGIGGGGRVGVFLDPRIALEFEKGEMRAGRTLGLKDVNVGILASHLVVTPIQSGAFSMHVGAGAGASTETNFLHSYGVNALVGAKLALSDQVSFRVDAISDWLANNDWKSFQRLHLGLSFFRQPNRVVRTVEVLRTVDVPVASATTQRSDSVSAGEQARRRRVEQDYRMLRDSLSRLPSRPAAPASSAAALATMEEKIHFASDKSELSAESRAILDAKVKIFRANPAMRIVIVGNADARSSDAYNMGLGGRRSSAAKAYLVEQGIDPVRIEVSTVGERNPIASGTSESAEATNRRAEFRLLIASDVLVAPR
ncbi:MAG: OmpA family protein [Gemmatimonadota bacterium]